MGSKLVYYVNFYNTFYLITQMRDYRALNGFRLTFSDVSLKT